MYHIKVTVLRAVMPYWSSGEPSRSIFSV